MSTIALPTATVIPCDDRCMFAKNDECDCVCQGENHKRGHLLTSAQREIKRTDAGRRIRLLAPGTPEFDIAMAMHDLETEEGLTRREIAAQFGVSAPCVRRALRSLFATLEAAEAQVA